MLDDEWVGGVACPDVSPVGRAGESMPWVVNGNSPGLDNTSARTSKPLGSGSKFFGIFPGSLLHHSSMSHSQANWHSSTGNPSGWSLATSWQSQAQGERHSITKKMHRSKDSKPKKRSNLQIIAPRFKNHRRRYFFSK